MRAALLVGVLMAVAAPAGAGQVTLRFEDGYVTLSAKNASVREVLVEWSKLGQTRVVNAEKLQGAPITLELDARPGETGARSAAARRERVHGGAPHRPARSASPRSTGSW